MVAAPVLHVQKDLSGHVEDHQEGAVLQGLPVLGGGQCSGVLEAGYAWLPYIGRRELPLHEGVGKTK